MLEILRFILSDWLSFLGPLILISEIFKGLALLISKLKQHP